MVARSGQKTCVAGIVTFDGDLGRAETGSAVTLAFSDQLDVARGDMIVRSDTPPAVTDQFAAHLIWLDEMHRATGAFVLVDRISARTVAAGMVAFALRRAGNVREQRFGVDKILRAHMNAQRPCILWFTGLPGAGKSTILNLVEQRLAERGMHTYALDGDNLRRGLNRDLGFTDFDRVENIRRAGEVARLMVDAGLVVLCAFVSPFRAERRMVRELVGPEEFLEVFVDTPIEVCMERDPKGLYAKARNHAVTNLTGVDSPYELPEHAELCLKTVGREPQAVADDVLLELRRRGIVPE
jgi:bifunctional enzyme CysN/CysC